jgi:hypothetical protein
MAVHITWLVEQGATVVGPKPAQSPSLTGFPECDASVRNVANVVWANVDGVSVKERVFGKGRVIWGKTLAEVFAQLKTPPDFEYTSTTGAKLATIHRRMPDADYYFVSNQKYRRTTAECTFRVSGRMPELWHADTGRIETAPVYRDEGGRTVVSLQLDPAESVFVVFRKEAPAEHIASIALAGDSAPKERNPVVTIKNARYQAPDGRGTDVTERVREMVKSGEYEIAATNALFGDPVYMVVKQLKIEYEIDGKPVTRTVGENETMTLLELPDAPAEYPSFELSGGESGEVLLTPWKSGAYELRYSSGRTQKLDAADAGKTTELTGPWAVTFPPGWGAPASVTLDKLISWPEHSDKGVKYFSGTAVYTKEFDSPAGTSAAVWLDLGRVKNFATVRLNGKELGVLWKAPFRVDISRALKPGKNRLEVKVTNLWPNRIIGDEQIPADVEWNGTQLKKWPDWLKEGKPRPSGRYTFTTWRFYNKDSPLLESGLIGPVTIRSAKTITVLPGRHVAQAERSKVTAAIRGTTR